MQLFHKESVDKEISLDDGLYMLSQYKLGRTSYTSSRQDLKLKVELPAHYKLMQHKNAIMLSDVCISLQESVMIHFERLIKLLSGRHSVYNQQGLGGRRKF